MTVVDDPSASAGPSTDAAETDLDATRVLALVDTLLADHPPATTRTRDFLGAQFDAGLAWVNFDEGCGGLGLPPSLQKLVQERLARAHAPHPYAANPIGYGMGAPTVASHGTPEQARGTCGRCSPARRCGASSSPSPAPAPTWPASPPGRCSTATSGP